MISLLARMLLLFWAITLMGVGVFTATNTWDMAPGFLMFPIWSIFLYIMMWKEYRRTKRRGPT